MGDPSKYHYFGAFEEKTIVQDEVGQEIETWAELEPAFFGKGDVRGQERVQAAQTLATETTIWKTHWVDWVRADIHRLNIDGKIYDIVGLAEIGYRDELEITAVAVRV